MGYSRKSLDEMVVDVPKNVWQAIAVVHDFLAGQCIANPDDVLAHNSLLRAENARLRSRLGTEGSEKDGEKKKGDAPEDQKTLRLSNDSKSPRIANSNSLQDLCLSSLRVISLDRDRMSPELPSPRKRTEETGSTTITSKDDGADSEAEPLYGSEVFANPEEHSTQRSGEQLDISRKASLGSRAMSASGSPQVEDALYDIWNIYDDPGTGSWSLMVGMTPLNCNTNSVSSKPSFRYNTTLSRSGALGGSTDSSASRSKCITIDPDSRPRVAWDLVTLFILAYDCIMVPMQLFDPPDHAVYKFIAVFSTCFWSMDMCASALTGIYVNGKLVMDSSRILRRYMLTWFFFDVIVVSLDWATLILSVSGVVDSMRILRLLRFMRLLKLLRLFKLEALFRKHSERSNIGVKIVLTLRFLSYMFGVLMFAHLLACIWYAIGNSEAGGWVRELRSDGFWYSYFSSFHWALTCVHGSSDLHPTTTVERGFAVVIICYSLFAVTWLQSTMTQMMIQMHTMSKTEVDQTEDLLTFFRERRITSALCQCIRGATKQTRGNKFLLERNVVLLKNLPRGLLMDLHAEMAAPILILHPFLSSVRDEVPRAMRQICHEAVYDYIAHRNETFFVNGDACQETYVLDHGTLAYTHRNDVDHMRIGHGQFAAEGALWMKWNNCGELVVVSPGCLLYKLDSQKFQAVFPDHLHAHIKACNYAKEFLARVQELGRTDILPTQ